MGTYISLKAGAIEIDLGKNFLFQDHCALFQEQDLTTLVEEEEGEEPLRNEAYSRSLGETVCRLELLGYTLKTVRREYYGNTDEYGDKIKRALTFKNFISLIKSIKLSDFKGQWSDKPMNHHVPDEVIKGTKSENYPPSHGGPDYWAIDMLLEGLSPYAKLRLLAENDDNKHQKVQWAFGHMIEGGYAKRQDFMRKLVPEQQFLIVTEGSSDSHVLNKALALLRPGYADFFRFVDMAEGYPFNGTGNLHNFALGLVSIGILNRVLILYDNDTEGVSKYELTRKLSLPKNMVVTKLPAIAHLRRFVTVGPNGKRKVNINGKAASIECYLDLNFSRPPHPVQVRWSSYMEKMGQYQGALEHKTFFTKAFLDLRRRDSQYDFSKMEMVLDHLYKNCVEMAACCTPILANEYSV